MSFDLFVVCVQNGMPSTIAREDLDRYLEAYIVERGKGFLNCSPKTLYCWFPACVHHWSAKRP
jgi:hypothetical protein